MFAKKAEPLSYAEGPRLQRSIQALSAEARLRFVNEFSEHLKSPKIETVQRRGAALYITSREGSKETVEVYDFGVVSGAQSCLTALTDCFRSHGSPVKVLMAESKAAP